MSDFSDALRAHVGHLLWCFNEGYVKAEDREGFENWLLLPDSALHENDVALKPHLLAMADELLSALMVEIKEGEAIAPEESEPKRRFWEDAVFSPAAILPSDEATTLWNPERVANLNLFQQVGRLHPYTCHNRSRATHPQRDGERDFGLLIATPDGWICRDCGFTQEWF